MRHGKRLRPLRLASQSYGCWRMNALSLLSKTDLSQTLTVSFHHFFNFRVLPLSNMCLLRPKKQYTPCRARDSEGVSKSDSLNIDSLRILIMFLRQINQANADLMLKETSLAFSWATSELMPSPLSRAVHAPGRLKRRQEQAPGALSRM